MFHTYLLQIYHPKIKILELFTSNTLGLTSQMLLKEKKIKGKKSDLKATYKISVSFKVASQINSTNMSENSSKIHSHLQGWLFQCYFSKAM